MNFDLVLHVDSNDAAILRMALRNAANYRAALPDETFRLCLVANAAAVHLFTREHEVFEKEARGLHEAGMRFAICQNALNEQNVARERLWDFCEVVPAGLVEIVRLQRLGFAYIKP